MSTTEDNDHEEEKKYCCGNSAQNEAGYVSKCDIAIVITGLVFYTLVTVLLFVDGGESVLRNYINSNPALKDLTMLITVDLLYKIIFLGASFVWLIFELGLAILLLRGSSMRNKHMLTKWFNLTICVAVIGITIAGFGVYYLEEKKNFGIAAFIYYMYKWYGLWICVELKKEIKLNLNTYTMPCDFATSF